MPWLAMSQHLLHGWVRNEGTPSVGHWTTGTKAIFVWSRDQLRIAQLEKIPLLQPALDIWTKTWQPFSVRLNVAPACSHQSWDTSYHSLLNTSNLLLIPPRPVQGWIFCCLSVWGFFPYFFLRADLPWHWRATFYSQLQLKAVEIRHGLASLHEESALISQWGEVKMGSVA